MVPLLLVLLLALLLFGAGFAVKALWWIAVIVLVVWLIGFVARPKGSTGRRRNAVTEFDESGHRPFPWNESRLLSHSSKLRDVFPRTPLSVKQGDRAPVLRS
jgi:hypothetical protein